MGGSPLISTGGTCDSTRAMRAASSGLASQTVPALPDVLALFWATRMADAAAQSPTARAPMSLFMLVCFRLSMYVTLANLVNNLGALVPLPRFVSNKEVRGTEVQTSKS